MNLVGRTALGSSSLSHIYQLECSHSQMNLYSGIVIIWNFHLWYNGLNWPLPLCSKHFQYFLVIFWFMKQLLYLISRKLENYKSTLSWRTWMYFHINKLPPPSTYFLNLISSIPCLYSVIFHTGLSVPSSISSSHLIQGTSPKLSNPYSPYSSSLPPVTVFGTSS